MGTFYFEFDGAMATRQVEVDKGNWYCSLDAYHPGRGIGLADQPFSDSGLSAEDEICAEEFESVWREAVRRKGR